MIHDQGHLSEPTQGVVTLEEAHAVVHREGETVKVMTEGDTGVEGLVKPVAAVMKPVAAPRTLKTSQQGIKGKYCRFSVTDFTSDYKTFNIIN